MELNKFTIGLILVVLVVFVGAIAASENKVIEKNLDAQANTTGSIVDFRIGADGYSNESNIRSTAGIGVLGTALGCAFE